MSNPITNLDVMEEEEEEMPYRGDVSPNAKCRVLGCRAHVPHYGCYPGLPQAHCTRCGMKTWNADPKESLNFVEPNYPENDLFYVLLELAQNLYLKILNKVRRWGGEMGKQITNLDIMNILEEIGKEWSVGKSVTEVAAVTDYLNMLCYEWMGGDWGLKPEHLSP
jgi:hypothetical protein